MIPPRRLLILARPAWLRSAVLRCGPQLLPSKLRQNAVPPPAVFTDGEAMSIGGRLVGGLDDHKSRSDRALEQGFEQQGPPRRGDRRHEVRGDHGLVTSKFSPIHGLPSSRPPTADRSRRAAWSGGCRAASLQLERTTSSTGR